MKKLFSFAVLCLAATFLFYSCQEEDFQNIQEEVIIEEIVEEINYKELREQFFQRSFLSTTNPNIVGSGSEQTPSDSNSFTNSELLGNEVYEEVSDWMKPGPTLGQIVSEIGFPAWEHMFIKDQLDGLEGVVLLPFAQGNGNHITAILYCFKISNDWSFKLSYSNSNPLSSQTGKHLPQNVEGFINHLLFGGESPISDLNYSITESGLKTIELDCIEEWECVVPPMAFTGGLPCNWEYQGEICSGGGGGSGNGGVLTSSGSSGSHYGDDTYNNGGTTGNNSDSDSDPVFGGDDGEPAPSVVNSVEAEGYNFNFMSNGDVQVTTSNGKKVVSIDAEDLELDEEFTGEFLSCNSFHFQPAAGGTYGCGVDDVSFVMVTPGNVVLYNILFNIDIRIPATSTTGEQLSADDLAFCASRAATYAGNVTSITISALSSNGDIAPLSNQAVATMYLSLMRTSLFSPAYNLAGNCNTIDTSVANGFMLQQSSMFSNRTDAEYLNALEYIWNCHL